MPHIHSICNHGSLLLVGPQHPAARPVVPMPIGVTNKASQAGRQGQHHALSHCHRALLA